MNVVAVPYAANICILLVASLLGSKLIAHLTDKCTNMRQIEAMATIVHWWSDIQTFVTTAVASTVGVAIADDRNRVLGGVLLAWSFARLLLAWRTDPEHYDRIAFPLVWLALAGFHQVFAPLEPGTQTSESVTEFVRTKRQAQMRRLSGATRLALTINVLMVVSSFL